MRVHCTLFVTQTYIRDVIARIIINAIVSNNVQYRLEMSMAIAHIGVIGSLSAGPQVEELRTQVAGSSEERARELQQVLVKYTDIGHVIRSLTQEYNDLTIHLEELRRSRRSPQPLPRVPLPPPDAHSWLEVSCSVWLHYTTLLFVAPSFTLIQYDMHFCSRVFFLFLSFNFFGPVYSVPSRFLFSFY